MTQINRPVRRIHRPCAIHPPGHGNVADLPVTLFLADNIKYKFPERAADVVRG